jgi:peptidoglycan hydrolase-like protein with peptidoglycan-binding domain
MTSTPNIARSSPPDYVVVTEGPIGSDYLVLKMGDSGDPVRRLQEELKKQGYYKINVTGNYGMNTHNAVLAFQQDHGLRVTGIADRATQRNLFEGDYPEGA